MVKFLSIEGRYWLTRRVEHTDLSYLCGSYNLRPELRRKFEEGYGERGRDVKNKKYIRCLRPYNLRHG